MTRLQSWFGELIAYRELLINLVVRDVKTRYKNSVLGFVWSLLSPLAMMVVFTVVFGVLYPNNNIQNFPIFLLSGLLPWNFFSTALLAGSNSVVANSNLVKKVYFPREILPLASVLSGLRPPAVVTNRAPRRSRLRWACPMRCPLRCQVPCLARRLAACGEPWSGRSRATSRRGLRA